jgi:hypothetical protein
MAFKIKTKKRPYGILTTNSTRIEVKARNVTEAYKLAKEELIRMHNLERDKKPIGLSFDTDLTSAYETYGREGVSVQGFIITPKSVEANKKYNLGKSSKSPLEVLYGKVEIGAKKEERREDNFKMGVYKDGVLVDMGYYATEEEAEKDFKNYDEPKGRTRIIEPN